MRATGRRRPASWGPEAVRPPSAALLASHNQPFKVRVLAHSATGLRLDVLGTKILAGNIPVINA